MGPVPDAYDTGELRLGHYDSRYDTGELRLDGGSARGASGAGGRAEAVRGGHPEQREPGGGWGALGGAEGAVPPAPRSSDAGAGAASRARGPRQEYVEAFDALDARLRRPRTAEPVDPVAPAEPFDAASGVEAPALVPAPAEAARPTRGVAVKGRTFTGVAAAAVTTVLAVVVAGQVTEGVKDDRAGSRPHGGEADRADRAPARGDVRATPQHPGRAAKPTYSVQMATPYPLDPKLQGSGTFRTIGGHDAAPGRGELLRYRVDVEKGLPLDGDLFAEAVHKTLNDDRSWAHGGRHTFERISTGRPNFVITLASPGTTAAWCAKSGLDTTVDNVSCDSAATPRVMINAYRWAQGAKTFGQDRMHAYRQMLINHEVGHRLGSNHAICSQQGALAPVMMQQTKFLTTDGVTCRPNPWPFPKGTSVPGAPGAGGTTGG
ncbi:DUF3152 domain-containing protein [Streptomyces palmae]|uniref:DUF3152 domain-containing protein n=1 Tax=Streptomyces palmae TaxID=1701085 RepID=A0A4Z0HDN0_9ACTN|nr:DUF3152 domain-containing protein [Streptomyces palmae]TGB13281.1 DUF3152 domain-containing protein [Streptomyces palmae]